MNLSASRQTTESYGLKLYVKRLSTVLKKVCVPAVIGCDAICLSRPWLLFSFTSGFRNVMYKAVSRQRFQHS